MEKNSITYADLYKYILNLDSVPQQYKDKAQDALNSLAKKSSKNDKSKQETAKRQETVYQFLSTHPGEFTRDELAQEVELTVNQVSSAMSTLIKEGLCIKGERKIDKVKKVVYACAEQPTEVETEEQGSNPLFFLLVGFSVSYTKYKFDFFKICVIIIIEIRKENKKNDIYVKFTASTPYCGTENEEYVAFPDDTCDDELDDYAEEFCQSNGEDYEYLATGWMCCEEDEEDTEQILEDYYSDCECSWERITEEEFNEAKDN